MYSVEFLEELLCHAGLDQDSLAFDVEAIFNT